MTSTDAWPPAHHPARRRRWTSAPSGVTSPRWHPDCAFFDAPGGTQTPTPVIEAIADALGAPLANRGLDNPAQRNAEQIVRDARSAMGDYLGNDPVGHRLRAQRDPADPGVRPHPRPGLGTR